jgi:hypothetical protein
MGKRNERRLHQWDKEKLIEMVLTRERWLAAWVAENSQLKDALKQMKRELDRAKHDLHVYGVRGDYIAMSERLAHAEVDLRGARADVKILEEALADKKVGNPNWEKVAELKMRKARY